MVGQPHKRARRAALAASAGLPATTAPLPAKKTLAPPAADPSTASFKAGMDASMGQIAAEQFEKLLGLSFDFAAQVMAMELDPTDKNFGKVLGVKQAIAASILTATTRTRAGDLRPRGTDVVGELLAKLNREEDGGDDDAETDYAGSDSETEQDLFS